MTEASLRNTLKAIDPDLDTDDYDKEMLIDDLSTRNLFNYQNKLIKEDGSNLLARTKGSNKITPDFIVNKKAFRSTVKNYKATEKWVPTIHATVEFLSKLNVPIVKQISTDLQKFRGAKVQLLMLTEYVKKKPNSFFNEYSDVWINSTLKTIIQSDVEEKVDGLIQDVIKSAENPKLNGSGWSFNKIIEFQIRIAQWIPLFGGSYCEIPSELKNTKAIINIKNDDDKCFLWSIMRHDYPVEKNQQRYADLKKKLKENPNLYNLDGIKFPVDEKQYKKFEKQNNKIINVFMYDNTNIKCPFIYPFYLSKNPNHKDAIDLLLYNDHYCLIKNFDGLNFSITKGKTKKYFCKRCLCHFKSEEKLNDHIVMCSKQDFCKVVMPKKR